MVDYEKISSRIKEQRKRIHRITQEKMAEDLGMYQADISNLENNKKGSGISDLDKLDLIAGYFGLSLQTLLFGGDGSEMLAYTGDKMALKRSSKALKKSHKKILERLTGYTLADSLPFTYTCGPYLIYAMMEIQGEPNEEYYRTGEGPEWKFAVYKPHFFVFYEEELIGMMTAITTTLMHHIFRPAAQQLKVVIPPDMMDVDDVLSVLNPYFALWLTEEDPDDGLIDRLTERNDVLRKLGQDRPIIYIERVYVREDCRRKGIFRMLIDLLKAGYEGCVLWLNMLPSPEGELEQEYTMLPIYSVADIGQLNRNASIAERLGFAVDTRDWTCQSEVFDAAGGRETKMVTCRKFAYFLPAELREVIKEDGQLLEVARAKQKLALQSAEEEQAVDLRQGMVDGWLVFETRVTAISGPETGRVLCYYAAAEQAEPHREIYAVSKRSAFTDGVLQEDFIESYSDLAEAVESEHFERLQLPATLLIENIENEI